MTTRDIVVIGGSAGSIQPLMTIASSLPADFPGTLFVVVHMWASAKSELAPIMARSGPLPVIPVVDGLPIQRGKIYVAQPNAHLLLERGHLHVTRGPKENHTRPAINPTFRSAAAAFGNRVIGVLLSGVLDDGVAGLWEIKRQGGIAIVQDPDDAQHSEMPRNALENVAVDHKVTAAAIPPLLTKLVLEDTQMGQIQEGTTTGGTPTRLTCPECRGSLERFQEGKIVEYRCRVKHTYSAETMLSAHAEAQERTLWAAVVALEEGAELVENVSQTLPSHQRKRLVQEIQQKRQLAQSIRLGIENLLSGDAEA
jgi:two-component system, chemotaxis family, protein-glutamate methylesterase/glutaminase